MSNESPPTLFTRFAQLPRAAQLAIGGAVLVLITMTYPTLLIKHWNKRADERLEILQSSSNQNRSTPEAERLQDTIIALGRVSRPASQSQAGNKLSTAVDSVLRAQGVPNWSFRLNRPSRLPPTTLLPILRGSQRVERITGDVSFVATPDVTMAIIAELERHPEIESITSVDLSKIAGGARKLDVRLVVEAWLLARGRSGGGV